MNTDKKTTLKPALETIFNKIRDELNFLKSNSDSYQLNNHHIDQERHDFLSCFDWGRTDIQAYPGTGKTTLLLDKLELLLKHWDLKSAGLLVLSHTNVAVDQIKNSPNLRNIQKYPHHVDTIHGFFNRFLGIPYARSKGWPIRVVDDDVCKKRARSKAENEGYFRQKPGFLEKLTPSLNIDQMLKSVGLTDQKSDTAKKLIAFREKLSSEGFFLHDDLLYMSNLLIEETPQTIQFLRQRFPVVFVDEAQDNSCIQTALLKKIFESNDEGKDEGVIQYIGDTNQRLFSASNQESESNGDIWHPTINKKNISNSFRCKQKIAEFASRFTKDKGVFVSAKTDEETGQGHLFYMRFDDPSTVLNDFSQYLKAKHPNMTNSVAIGFRGEGGELSNKTLSLASYGNYQADVSKTIGFKTALANLSKLKSKTQPKEMSLIYQQLLKSLEREVFSKLKPEQKQQTKEIKETLKGILKDQHLSILRLISGDIAVEDIFKDIKSQLQLKRLIDELFDFKNDQPASSDTSKTVSTPALPLKTIHSVKGETYNAVLVLETSTHKNTLDCVLNEKKLNYKELKQIKEAYFVAFSRAADVLCLALQKPDNNSLTEEKLSKMGFSELPNPQP